ncbi:MAG TPA: pyridoxal phosphate-dependent class II aminotransferase, partial [Desulfatirhabdiaceae bacterium]|nr:pyridoxal phosphate-dependent class II aminotransferase [Desulfatirhabdiaceae bacterium]
MISGHGGNIYEWAAVLKCRPVDILDMSSNVNPLGPIPGLDDYLISRIDQISALPEADAGTMISGFADFYGIDPSRV